MNSTPGSGAHAFLPELELDLDEFDWRNARAADKATPAHEAEVIQSVIDGWSRRNDADRSTPGRNEFEGISFADLLSETAESKALKEEESRIIEDFISRSLGNVGFGLVSKVFNRSLSNHS